MSPLQAPEDILVPWGSFSHSTEQPAWEGRFPLELVSGDKAASVGGGWAVARWSGLGARAG
jgi:hypothetical protein